MELVYLWVEDYKNIHKQGFNFSSRFRCEYDDEKNELTIDENDDYIENFFGENINVTAIVGKNGSGKSSIVEIFDNNCNNMKVLYKLGNTFYTNFNLKNEYKQKYHINFFFYLEDFYDIHISNKVLTCNDSEPDNCKLLTIANVLEFDKKCFDFLNQDFIFTKWKINFQKRIPYLHKKIEIFYGEYKFLSSIFLEETNSYLNIFTFVAIEFIQYILAKKSLKKSKYWKMLQELSNNFTKENYLVLVNSIEVERVKDIGHYDVILTTLQKYDESIEYIDNFLEKKEISSFDIKNFINSGVYITFHNFSNNRFRYKILNIEYLTEKNLYYSDLSSGEQQRIVNNALLIQNIMDKNNNYNYHFCVFDEPDMYLHPNWQKTLIDDFINISKKYIGYAIESIHLIVTSHSPFLLSDIPKQNIIFLDKDEKGNCKVVDGLKEKKQTFGANIHTLLSDSFFMEDGLMGEFAKGKIDKAIELLNQDKLDEKELKYCEQIISIVGEPIVKNQLQRMLDSKRLKKVDEIDAIKKSMESMQQRLDELEK